MSFLTSILSFSSREPTGDQTQDSNLPQPPEVAEKPHAVTATDTAAYATAAYTSTTYSAEA